MATVVPTYTNGAGWSNPQLQPYVDATGFIPEGGPLTQDLAAGSHKITGLANGTNPQDAATYGQITAAPVSSVFGRTGAVVAANGDYTAAQVGALASGVAAGGVLAGTLPSPSFAAAAFGSTGSVACVGNDSRLSDQRASSQSVDQIATAHATAADWSNNSHKITNLANGASAQDAAAFGQIPTALPPNGAAGGGLGATFPNPSVNADGTTITNAGSTLAVLPAILGGVVWTTIRCGSDLGRNTTTTVAIDPTLQFTATSGVAYEIELFIIYVSTAGGGTPDMKIAFGEDNSLRGSAVTVGLNSADSSVVSSGNTALSNQPIYGTAATNRVIHVRCWHVGAGGTFQLQWAQGTSNGNDTTRKAGSVLRYRGVV